MQYALLVYAPPEDTDRAARPIPGTIAAQLDQPDVTGWVRLHAAESATTLRNGDGLTLLTDGPFIDSKEYLAGLILIEAGNLDGARRSLNKIDARYGGLAAPRSVDLAARIGGMD